MSKSTLEITVWSGPNQNIPRTYYVPCRLPEAFNFRHGGWVFTANLYGDTVNGPAVSSVETEADDGVSSDHHDGALEAADAILATIKATLGITGPVPPGSPLPAIALAYEAECAAHSAQLRAYAVLPRTACSGSIIPPHPSDEVATGIYSPAARMLAKYVEYVVEQAAKEAK